ncbi:PDR/VanB family oxidoreductase [Litoreibacter roseus]|uniref:Oxidoreductase n=1 Tax=Litoreibacter roseus TaxID=2601869 RepID=A0A6N6JLN3_9RHOB|nr:PDR/VanB family oxidoreductase [Litoreibacter roseus]GFE66188.1 oxidoreductase [Litoreibacter roseus]
MSNTLKVTVIGKAIVGEDTVAFRLAGQDTALPACEAGAHIDVHLPSGLIRQYSLTRATEDNGRYEIGVLRDAGGRGGSVEICDTVRVGDTVEISPPRNNFGLHPSHGKSVLLAGGIGVTPLLSMARTLEARGAGYELRICARTPERAAFRCEIQDEAIAANIIYHYDEVDDPNPLDIAAFVGGLRSNDHLYACGPTGFLDAVQEAASRLPAGHFHQERFKANLAPLSAEDAGEFEVQLKGDGPVYPVAKECSILETLREQGVSVPQSCLEGVCGTCIVQVLDSGEIIHRDTSLYPDEQEQNSAIALCVSRGAPGSRIVLDL